MSLNWKKILTFLKSKIWSTFLWFKISYFTLILLSSDLFPLFLLSPFPLAYSPSPFGMTSGDKCVWSDFQKICIIMLLLLSDQFMSGIISLGMQTPQKDQRPLLLKRGNMHFVICINTGSVWCTPETRAICMLIILQFKKVIIK